ncbi:hypothetical protein Theco_2828 [Thermobacillus composti KWC4]|uniref:Uncharacterized protein n=1 Tax=Thermobacillus composti (strain DSM 18247 / JCM 13945 / KWC4) TaxID=717605 RepID=L0EF66_THECK|nr:hypothetical protein [Thermobacillus composti]AGA58913.1 hypothetical protein Theco_2828 [Thermobacillus composti KWC4]
MNDFCYALLLMSVAASILYLLLKLFIPLAPGIVPNTAESPFDALFERVSRKWREPTAVPEASHLSTAEQTGNIPEDGHYYFILQNESKTASCEKVELPVHDQIRS